MNFGHYNRVGQTQTYTGTEVGGRSGAIIGMIISFPVILIGIILLIITIFSYVQDFEKQSYVETNATITEKWVDNDAIELYARDDENTDEVTKYKISYIIDNVTYTYDDILLTMISGESTLNQNLTVGDTIVIRYNPKNPDEIDYTYSRTSMLFPILTLFMLLCGGSAFVHNLKKLKKPESACFSSGVSISYGDMPSDPTCMSHQIVDSNSKHIDL